MTYFGLNGGRLLFYNIYEEIFIINHQLSIQSQTCPLTHKHIHSLTHT